MIILGNRIFTPMKIFENEEKLWVYLQTQANLKPDGDETDSGKWRFAYYSHRILKDVTDMMDNASFRNLACQSVAAQQNYARVLLRGFSYSLRQRGDCRYA